MTGRRHPLLLALLVIPTAVFLGVGTLWSVESERSRAVDAARTAAREALSDAARLIEADVVARMKSLLDRGREFLRDGQALPEASGAEGEPVLVAWRQDGRRAVPPSAPLVRLESLLEAIGGAEQRDLSLALTLGHEGAGEGAMSLLEDVIGRTGAGEPANALARFYWARWLHEQGRRGPALDALRALADAEDGATQLTSAQRFFVVRELLDDACRRRDARDAERWFARGELENLPLITTQGSVARHWIEALAELAGEVLPVQAASGRRRAAAAAAVAEAVALLPDEGPPPELASATGGPSRMVIEGQRAVGEAVTDETGVFLGTVLVLPPRRITEIAADETLRGIGARGFSVRLAPRDAPTGADAVRVVLPGQLTHLALVAHPVSAAAPFPWRTAITVLFLGSCVLVAVFGVRLVLRSARREAELVAARSEFLATVSHQLKTPVANLRLFAETLASGTVNDEADRARMQQILQSEAEKLGGYLDRVLSVARLDHGASGDGVPERIDVAAMMRGLAERWRGAVAARGNGLELEVDDDLPAVAGDARALADALQNVVDNALRHTRAGSTVVVSATVAAEAVELRVRDAGEGIPEAWHERIFERFFRGEGDHVRAGEGTGLGLSIARDGVRRAGGTVRVERSGSDGTTILMTLPAANRGEPRGHDLDR